MKLFAISLLSLVALIGCNDDETKYDASAHIHFTMDGQQYNDQGYPVVTMRVNNQSNRSIYNAYCDVYFLAADKKTILDTGFAYFASGAIIFPGWEDSEIAVGYDLRYKSYAYVSWSCGYLWK